MLEVMFVVVAVEARASAESSESAAVTSASILSKSSLSSATLIAVLPPWRSLVFLFPGMPARMQLRFSHLQVMQCM
jgi:hypothetical protein